MTEVVYRPAREHHCRPGVEEGESTGEGFGALPRGTVYLIPPDPWRYPRGTIVRCDCGRTWVSEGSPAPHMPGMCTFRPEGWLERWRRERRARR